jgi:cytochrome c-type biogenesis protein CcmH
MKLSTFFLIILVTFSLAKLSAAEKNEELKNKISKNIRCLICQGQSVYDSQSDFSESVKLIIENKLNEGLSENEIYDFLINKYGEWISYDPKFNKKTFILWILPILLFVIGGAIIVRKLIIQKL